MRTVNILDKNYGISKRMNYAIIAAGEGSRLAEEGICTPKPLVPILGKPMLVRLLDLMSVENAETIAIIINPQMPEVLEVLRLWQETHKNIDLRICQQRTPSSMHSFSVLSEVMPVGRFILTTVDALFQPDCFHAFVSEWEKAEKSQMDALFAVTPFVDDEKPLWISTDREGMITEFSDEGPRPFVSGGIYAFHTDIAFPVLEACLASGQSRMRNFQRALLEAGQRIRSFVFPKIMDIDHASDISKAEKWLSGESSVLLVYRAPEFSPNSVEKDAAILNAVGKGLEASCDVCYVSETEVTRELLNNFARVYSMGRRQQTLLLLQQAIRHRPELRVVNHPAGVQITTQSRSTTLELLATVGINVPAFWSYEPANDDLFQCDSALQQLLPGWVKGMHPAGVSAGDVSFVETPLEADTKVITMASQGYVDIIVSRHCPGTLLKVYCVVTPEEKPWLRWFAPDSVCQIEPGKTEVVLSDMAQRIAGVLNLQVFGFDVICDQEGSLWVIDVNDWPSFSVFQEGAAKEIAKL